MAYLVIAYPKISQKDYYWVQKYRKENDPLYYKVVEPHFTLVFPTFDLTEEVFVEGVTKLSARFKKFPFVVRIAVVNKDSFNDYYHEFLVPDEGFSNFVKMKDKLYSGTLSKFLRLDIDFIPHIGIGNSINSQICKSRVDIINEGGLEIAGKIESLSVVKYQDDIITQIKVIDLK